MKPEPVLSVIVPTYNRSAILRKCLRALSSQNCDPDLIEVVVSDDGSTDDTRQAAAEAAKESPVSIQYLHQNNAGANRARNRAIQQSRGRLLLFINDDTIATSGMLSHHIDTHAIHPDDRIAVLGRVTVSPELPPSRLAPLHLDYSFERLEQRREHDWRAFFTCNVSAKRTLLERGGLFEERIRYHEDLELAQRLSHHGLRVVYCPEALGYHDHYLTEEEFMAIAGREARALVRWYRLAPQLAEVLGTLGFEPAAPLPSRLKHQAIDLIVNRATLPFWRAAARRCPDSLASLSLLIYRQMYQSLRRSTLRRELRAGETSQ